MKKIIVEFINTGNLSPRESQVAALLCEGFSDKSIIRALGISNKTLRTHLDRIYMKLESRQHECNVRCATLATLVARKMVKLSICPEI